MAKISRIEVEFAEPVDITPDQQREIQRVVSEICDNYTKSNPGRVMWLFTYGSKMMSNPFLVDADHPMEFDSSVLHVECYERKDHAPDNSRKS